MSSAAREPSFRINLLPIRRSRSDPDPPSLSGLLVGRDLGDWITGDPTFYLSVRERRVLTPVQERLDQQAEDDLPRAMYPALGLTAVSVAVTLGIEHVGGLPLFGILVLGLLFWFRFFSVTIWFFTLGTSWWRLMRNLGTYAGDEAEPEPEPEIERSSDAFEGTLDETERLLARQREVKDPSTLLAQVREQYQALLGREAPLRKTLEGPGKSDLEREAKRLQAWRASQPSPDLQFQTDKNLESLERLLAHFTELQATADGLALRRGRLSHSVNDLRAALLQRNAADAGAPRARAENQVREALDHLNAELGDVGKALRP